MPPSTHRPGLFIEEVPSGNRPIKLAPTSATTFVDRFVRGPVGEPKRITSFHEFKETFGGLEGGSAAGYGVQQFFLNGGQEAHVVRTDAVDGQGVDCKADPAGLAASLIDTGLPALRSIPNGACSLLCLPAAAHMEDHVLQAVYVRALDICRELRAFCILDIPSRITGPDALTEWAADAFDLHDEHAALYYPRLTAADAANDFTSCEIASSGTLAGIYARTDADRGVWKAPAGFQAQLRGATPAAAVDDTLTDELTVQSINPLRTFPDRGHLVWGARTFQTHNPKYRYIPVKRTALCIEQSLIKGLAWTAFEPNTDTLWFAIRRNMETFLHDLWTKGAFTGNVPRDAYFVRCDATTTSPTDIDQGQVNVHFGFAPSKPAEFIVLKLTLSAAIA